MKRALSCAALASCLSVTAAVAQTSAADGDASARALGQCLVGKSTGEDRTALMRWMATAMLASPQVADLGTVADTKRETADRAAAAVFTRLLTKDCLAPAQVVMRSSGEVGMQVAGEALGRVAMQELLGDPKAAAAMSGFTRFLDAKAFAALGAGK